VTASTVFQSLTFDEAMARARAEDRWLIVAATSASSEIARMMDETTWTNQQVAGWFAKAGIALRVDVDAQPELARTLKIDAAPAVVAFKSGVEKERVSGFLDPARLLIWLLSLESGRKTIYDQMISKGGGDFEHDMHARLSFAKSLLRAHSHVKAMEHYVWLWRNIERVDPNMRGVRVSFMASEIKDLIDAHRPARDSFAEIRDQTGAAADADPTTRDLRLDWVVLNHMLGEDDRTIAWFDTVKGRMEPEAIARCAGPHLVELLKARGRWADVGRLCINPLKDLAFYNEVRGKGDLPLISRLLPKEALAHMEEISRQHFRKAAAELYTAMRAAGRTADAKEVHDEALRLDPSDEMKRALHDSPVRYD